jgi:hypothetical protein
LQNPSLVFGKQAGFVISITGFQKPSLDLGKPSLVFGKQSRICDFHRWILKTRPGFAKPSLVFEKQGWICDFRRWILKTKLGFVKSHTERLREEEKPLAVTAIEKICRWQRVGFIAVNENPPPIKTISVCHFFQLCCCHI